MKNCLRPLPVLLAIAFVGALASCSNNADTPGAVNVERGAPKTFVPKEGAPAVPGEGAPAAGKDSAAAGLHRNPHPVPTGEQLYDRANKSVDHNHDGKADH